uniref:Uncharacterized protein n=1 Tax=Leersia perrieri TaxID=77586 RepID=A0A0D9WU67_9ORYZ
MAIEGERHGGRWWMMRCGVRPRILLSIREVVVPQPFVPKQSRRARHKHRRRRGEREIEGNSQLNLALLRDGWCSASSAVGFTATSASLQMAGKTNDPAALQLLKNSVSEDWRVEAI